MDLVELRPERPDRPSIIVHPGTGEVLDLAGDTEILVRWLREVREMESEIREVKRVVTGELIDRMDREARYTLHVGDLEVKGDGPIAPTLYEGEQLRNALAEYVEAGVITPEALDRAVEVLPTYRPRTAGIKALKRLGGPIADLVDQHAKPKESYERRVTIKEREARKAVSA